MSGRWRGTPQIVLLRPVGAGTAMHRLWAGTKLLCVAAVSLTMSFEPTWTAIALGAALVALGVLVARVPWAARPRIGWWLWAILLVGAALTLVTGGKPEIAIPGGHVGLGALDEYGRFASFGVVLFVASLLLGWTTPTSELAPAVASLGRPLRIVRVPVDEWAVTIALTVRCLPLLVEETRVLLAARRLRPTPDRQEGLEGWLNEAADLLVAVMVSALRRASEMAEAITARGGTGQVAARRGRPGRLDVLVGVIVGATCAAAWALSVG